MRFYIKIPLLTFFLLLNFSNLSNCQSHTFNTNIKREELIKDFELLWKALNASHPALYKYTSKEELTAIYHKRLNSITDMTQHQFFLFVSSFISKVRCVHTITQPSDNYIEYLLKHCKMFPFNVRYLDKRGYITKNFTNDTTITMGSEIISINNIPFQKIVDSLFQYYRSDGFIDTYKIWVAFTGNTFKYHFSQYIDTSQQYSMVYIDLKTNQEKSFHSEGITHVDFLNYIKGHESDKERVVYKKLKLNIHPDSNLAILTLKSFHNGELKDSKENYYRFLKAAFKTIENSKVDNLIIDLRDNMGGLNINASILYSYLTREEFDIIDYVEITAKDFTFMAENINRKKPKTFKEKFVYKNNGIFSTTKPNVKACCDIHKPTDRYPFTKKVYVLINGGTASASTFFNYAVLMNNRGIFIGEEEGGNIDGCTAMESIRLTLPNSKIAIDIPLNHIRNVRVPNIQSGRGLMPDYTVTPTINDVLEQKDVELNFAIELIQKANIK